MYSGKNYAIINKNLLLFLTHFCLNIRILQDNFLFQGGGRRRSGGYGDRRQYGNKKFRRKIV